MLELRLRVTASDAEVEAVRVVTYAANDIGLILWFVNAYTNPQSLAG